MPATSSVLAHAGHTTPEWYALLTSPYAVVLVLFGLVAWYGGARRRRRSSTDPDPARSPAGQPVAPERQLLSVLVVVVGVGLVAASPVSSLLHKVDSSAVISASSYAVLLLVSVLAALISNRRPVLLAGVVATVVFVAIFRIVLPIDGGAIPSTYALATGGLLAVCLPSRSRSARVLLLASITCCWLVLVLGMNQATFDLRLSIWLALLLMALGVAVPAALNARHPDGV